jgi:hypothetical protein
VCTGVAKVITLYTHKVPKGVFNVLQNSLAYQIQPEKAKALCVCVLSTQQTVLLPFTKEYSVQLAHIQPEKAANSEESI